MTWNHEYAAGEWDSRSLHTPNDPIYEVLVKYCTDRNVCDIGSGHGNTVVELPPIYRTYTGVDISDVALRIAAKRAAETGRQRVTFIQGCMHTFKPAKKMDVFLFRESLMYVCRRRNHVASEMSNFLQRYASMLAPGGMMVIRLCTGTAGEAQLAYNVEAIVREKFGVIERRCTQKPPSLLLVFRPVCGIRE
jgi:2-polyprenyl-3-methyl-5-hydroxy-6-metoxy-1,4-benzoquinol methylase